jgi:hypothetical protein
MNDRIAELEAAIRAQAVLICDAQVEITNYLSGEIESPELVNRLIHLFDCQRQRDVQRKAREALSDEELAQLSEESDMSNWFVFSQDLNGRDARSRAHPNEDAALSHARDLMRQRHEVDRIEGPYAQVIDKWTIERRLALRPET